MLLHRPEIYLELQEDFRDSVEVEEFVPESAEDIQSMLAEIRREGFLE